MSGLRFFAAGALTSAQADLYVQRQGDRDLLEHTIRMDYICLIEPRQQGKTSAINHLMITPLCNNMDMVYLDTSSLCQASESEWYSDLYIRISKQLDQDLIRSISITTPQDHSTWRAFLLQLADQCAARLRPLVLILDEIGTVRARWATEFFVVLREVFNSRQRQPTFSYVTFVLAGSFHPRDLVQDDSISPFNVAHRVRLLDFTLEQVGELLMRGQWPKSGIMSLAARVHYWTNGQPYLTQRLSSYLGPDSTLEDTDVAAARLRREDENHLPPILRRLDQDRDAQTFLRRVGLGAQIQFYPLEDSLQSRLDLLGVLKSDASGFCMIRNRLCELVLSGRSWPSVDQSVTLGRKLPFFWSDPNATVLLKALVSAYGAIEISRVRRLVEQAGCESALIHWNQAVIDTWSSILESAGRQGKATVLIDLVLRDPSVAAHHEHIRSLAAGMGAVGSVGPEL
ncbi:MAG: AAA-like domain-containing protein [Ardenticatenia bacterium]|nr:AAA-like domain-containing protein [Ardenticatenia bacterium]